MLGLLASVLISSSSQLEPITLEHCFEKPSGEVWCFLEQVDNETVRIFLTPDHLLEFGELPFDPRADGLEDLAHLALELEVISPDAYFEIRETSIGGFLYPPSLNALGRLEIMPFGFDEPIPNASQYPSLANPHLMDCSTICAVGVIGGAIGGGMAGGAAVAQIGAALGSVAPGVGTAAGAAGGAVVGMVLGTFAGALLTYAQLATEDKPEDKPENKPENDAKDEPEKSAGEVTSSTEESSEEADSSEEPAPSASSSESDSSADETEGTTDEVDSPDTEEAKPDEKDSTPHPDATRVDPEVQAALNELFARLKILHNEGKDPGSLTQPNEDSSPDPLLKKINPSPLDILILHDKVKQSGQFVTQGSTIEKTLPGDSLVNPGTAL